MTDNVLAYMDIIRELGGVYLPYRLLDDADEKRRKHTSGRREDRREIRYVKLFPQPGAKYFRAPRGYVLKRGI
jgi:hypothetical protein